MWPQDPQFALALAGGVTSLQVLPGSANLIGGRGVTLKNVSARDVYAMKFPGAPYGLKMACGENPKRVTARRDARRRRGWATSPAIAAAWIRAAKYRHDWEAYARQAGAGESGASDLPAPDRDLELDTLAGVLAGEILVQNHCYRADEMVTMIEIAKEFDYRISAFHHAVEAYKIADVLAENGICADVWADWWGFKMEAFDGIRENAALVHAAGGCAVIHSDSAVGIQRLNQEAAKAMAAGNRIGLRLREEEAIRWLTIHPAKSIGVGESTGSLEAGKMADVVIWSGNPFSVYSHAEQVYIDGALVFDRNDRAHQPVSDFCARHDGDEPMKRTLLILGLAAACGVRRTARCRDHRHHGWNARDHGPGREGRERHDRHRRRADLRGRGRHPDSAGGPAHRCEGAES